MAASHDECIAAFPRSQVCMDRSYSRLIAWASYTASLPLPPDTSTAPDKAWVQQRVLAERTPLYANSYAPQVMPYMLEVPNVTDDIRSHLNAFNDEATETTLVGEIDQSLAVIMPKYAAAAISDGDVANWCDRNGYPRPDGLIGVTPAITPMPMMIPTRAA